VPKGLLRRRPPLRLPAANAGRLWLEPRERNEGRPFRAMRASCSTVPLPDDKVSRLVADRFALVTSDEASDRQVELYEAVNDPQSREGRRQAGIEPKLKPRYTRVSPNTR
jgi:hypothetical protein